MSEENQNRKSHYMKVVIGKKEKIIHFFITPLSILSVVVIE